jgi:hypothetical protein
VARRPLGSDDECDSSPAVPRYPLRSNSGVVLVSPLHTPHRRHNTYVSFFFLSFYSPFVAFFVSCFIFYCPSLFLLVFLFPFLSPSFSPLFLLSLPFSACFFISLPFPLVFTFVSVSAFRFLWISSLAYPNLLETKRLSCCCSHCGCVCLCCMSPFARYIFPGIPQNCWIICCTFCRFIYLYFTI